MAAMTVHAVMAIAMHCVSPNLVPIAVGIVQHENHSLDPTVRNYNPNGTVDYGWTQINTINLGWLGLTPKTALNPCANLRAGLRVMFARYNGNPPDAVKASYSAGMLSKIEALDGVKEVTKGDFSEAASIASDGARPNTDGNVYIKPAHSGRDLVFSDK